MVAVVVGESLVESPRGMVSISMFSMARGQTGKGVDREEFAGAMLASGRVGVGIRAQ